MFRLPATIYSPDQVEALHNELTLFVDDRRDREIKESRGVTPSTPALELSADLAAVVALAAARTGGQISLEQLEDLGKQLARAADSYPTYTLTMAMLPTPSVKEQLVTWIRQNLDASILVRFTVNRNLLGGVVVRTPNHVYDYSFRRQFLVAAEKLPEIIKRV